MGATMMGVLSANLALRTAPATTAKTTCLCGTPLTAHAGHWDCHHCGRAFCRDCGGPIARNGGCDVCTVCGNGTCG
ncbi:MAG: hypothetical protein Kow0074_23550 [Candidatus Zixiibacteriota bacterium]